MKTRITGMGQNRSTRALLKRLASMGADEIRVRSLQEVSKYSDLLRYRLGIGFADRGQSNEQGAMARFFFGIRDVPQISNWIRDHLPQTAGEIVERAERICSHHFDLLGYKGLQYGPEIDWHLDIVHGKRAPLRPWFKIRYLDFQEVGDSKVIWELNRHQHLVTLAKAYHLTGDKKFVDELFEQWFHWQEHNPYPIGINWASSLEVAFRSLSWLWVLHLLQECSFVPGSFVLALRRALSLSARHIERYLSTYFSPNTHLLGEAVGLFFIGTMCPELPHARQWQSRGWKIVLEQAKRQVHQDGMHFEQSVYYHTYATDFFLHASILAKLNGICAPASFECTLEKMLEGLCRLGQGRVIQQFGDDDGGRLFDPQRNHAEHLLDPLATGAVLFRRSDFKSVAVEPREETVWLLGIDGAKRFESLATQKQGLSSFALESSGIYISADAEAVPQQLTLDAGPQGAGRAGHGHADALSVQLSVAGQQVLVDCGTSSYVDDDGGDRDQFRCTAAHNTLQVDSCDQAEPAGPFGWKQLPNVQAERWLTGESFDFFVGSHSGYSRLSNPVQHSRYVVHLKSRFWLVRDVVRGKGAHRLDLYWHAAPHLLASDSGAGVLLSDRDRPLLALLPVNGHCWQQKITSRWYSPVYGVKETCTVVQFSTEGALPKEFATVLAPSVNGRGDTGVLTALNDDKHGDPVSAYIYSASGHSDYVFFGKQEGTWRKGNWASDAAFLLCETDATGNLRHLVVCDGSYVEIGGYRVFASQQPMARYEWMVSPNGKRSYCSDPDGLICGPDPASVNGAQNSLEAGVFEVHRG
jgi:hypothetical protein